MKGKNLQFKSPLVLHLLNLKDGSEKKFALPEGQNQAGDIVWSPLQKQLVLTVSENEGRKFSLIWIDLQTGEQTMIIPDAKQVPFNGDTGLISAVSWSEENTILLSDRLNSFWPLNLVTRQIQVLPKHP